MNGKETSSGIFVDAVLEAAAAELVVVIDAAVRAAPDDPLDRIELVADGQVVDSIPGEGKRMIAFESQIRSSGPGTLYVRVVQTNGGAAWSGPFFLE